MKHISRTRRYAVITACRFLHCQSSTPWHRVCFLTISMAQGRITFGALIAVGAILIFAQQIPAQQSTAPPSSLSTRPLTPGHTESDLHPSCDLCRKPQRRPESDLRPQRLRHEKGLRPHKHAKGTHRSFDQTLKSTLPRRPLAPPQDSPTGGLAE